MKLAAALVALMTATVSAQAEPDQYLCISDYVGGVHYNPQTKTWGPTTFAPGRKYVLRRLKGQERQGLYPIDGSLNSVIHLSVQEQDPSKSEWGFFVFGDKVASATCDASFKCTTEPALHFEERTSKFEFYWLSGYSYQEASEDQTPEHRPLDPRLREQILNHPDDGSVAVGKCTAF